MIAYIKYKVIYIIICIIAVYLSLSNAEKYLVIINIICN